MIKAKHHFFLYPFFTWLGKRMINRHFHNVVLKGDVHASGKSILLISNHTTWWDGFWVQRLNMQLWQKRFYFMMLREQLEKHWFFQYTGGFSVEKKRKSVLDSIAYSAEILEEGSNLLMIFPQGKIQSCYRTNLDFERGVDYIVKKTRLNVQIVFLVNLVDYLSNKRPTLYQYIQEYKFSNFNELKLEDAYNSFYKNVLEKQRMLD